MDLSKYRDLFSAECQRLLGTVESKLSDPEALRADAQAVFRAFHTLKGMSATMNVPAMVLVAHALEEVCHRVVQGEVAVGDELTHLLGEGIDRLRTQLTAFMQGIEPLTEGAFEDRVREFLRTGGTFAFTLVSSVEETAQAPSENGEERATDLHPLADAQGAIAEALSAVGRLRGMVGESAMTELSRVEDAVRKLYDELVSLRNVPFGSSLPASRRQVRNVAARHGRQAQLHTTGDDVLVDSALLGRLHGAIVALLNNAVVHGIESPDDRVEMGKPKLGRIGLHAERVGRNLVVRVEDDGSGFDVASLSRGGADPMREAFRAGVSTAAEVDHDAGRGMGLDAVREVVEAVGGSLSVTSTPGEGTRVRIVAPVMADLVRLTLVRAGDQVLGLRHASIVGMGDVELCEPLFDLCNDPAVGLKLGDGRIVGVDALLESGDFLVSAPPFPLHLLRHLRGTTVAPDGRILLVVEP